MQDRVCEITESESSDFLGFRKYQREAEYFRKLSFSESAGAREGSVRDGTGLQFYSQYSRRELRLISCDWEQFLEVERRPEDRYDLAEDILVSCNSITRVRDFTRLATAFCALVSKL